MPTLGFPLAFLIALSIFLSGCGSPSEGAAPSSLGSIVLTVTDTAGNPLSGALVRLSSALAREEVAVADGHALSTSLSTTGYTIQTAEVTDSDGQAPFTRVPPGNYTLQASKEGMSHPSIRFQVTNSESFEQTIMLRPIKEVSLITAFQTVPEYQATFNGSLPGPTIAVEPETMVRITFSVPENDIVHVLRIDELGIKSPSVRPGNFAIIEFIANGPREIYYYCPLPGHRALGMEGKLVIRKERSTE